MGYIAGQLRHPITLQKPTKTVNASGRPVETWADVATVYSQKLDVSSREFYQALAYNAEDVLTFVIRYRSDVTTSWRLKSSGQIYQILGINHLGYKYDFLQLKCRSIKGAV